MILRPLSGVNISDFTITIVRLLIRNHNINGKYITKIELLSKFKIAIYFHPNPELRQYYNTCLRLMLIGIDANTQFYMDRHNNIITL